MGYYDKKNPLEPIYILHRVKNLEDLVIGNEYHIRKILSIEGNSITDEVYNIKLKSVVGNLIEDAVTEEKFQVGDKNFEVFYRKKLQ